MIKFATIAVLLQGLVVPAAMADGCGTEVQRIEQALERMELSEDERQQISEMNAEAKALCRTGDLDGAEEVITEAKAMLNLD